VQAAVARNLRRVSIEPPDSLLLGLKRRQFSVSKDTTGCGNSTESFVVIAARACFYDLRLRVEIGFATALFASSGLRTQLNGRLLARVQVHL
jgi:hypothetical protein